MSKVLRNREAYTMAFGMVVAAERKRYDHSQVYFAKVIGVSQPTLSRIERGLVLPDAYLMGSIALQLKLSVSAMNAHIDHVLSIAIRTSTQPGWEEVFANVSRPVIRGLIAFVVADTGSE